jgi:hypothetical protein
MVKTFRLKYTELIGEEMERSSELIIETKDIKRSMDKFKSGKNILTIEAIGLNNKLI